jgi:CRISPR type I-D-associated protein Csc2
MKVNELPEWIDFSADTDVAQKGKMDRAYIRENNFIAIAGVKKLVDFARFTSHEDTSIDRLEFMNAERLYLTGLKRRAVMRRASEGILRSYAGEYAYLCATPDHQCMSCYNCYVYGGLRTTKKDTKGLRARIKPVTAFSIQPYRDAVTSEPEFHIMVHRNLSMDQGDQKSASIYEVDLIRPGTLFPFVDIIFNPSQFDLAMYFETLKRADAEGYGSRASLYGAMETDIRAVYYNWAPGQEALHTLIENETVQTPGDVQTVEIDPDALRNDLSDKIELIRKTYGDTVLFGKQE